MKRFLSLCLWFSVSINLVTAGSTTERYKAAVQNVWGRSGNLEVNTVVTIQSVTPEACIIELRLYDGPDCLIDEARYRINGESRSNPTTFPLDGFGLLKLVISGPDDLEEFVTASIGLDPRCSIYPNINFRYEIQERITASKEAGGNNISEVFNVLRKQGLDRELSEGNGFLTVPGDLDSTLGAIRRQLGMAVSAPMALPSGLNICSGWRQGEIFGQVVCTPYDGKLISFFMGDRHTDLPDRFCGTFDVWPERRTLSHGIDDSPQLTGVDFQVDVLFINVLSRRGRFQFAAAPHKRVFPTVVMSGSARDYLGYNR